MVATAGSAPPAAPLTVGEGRSVQLVNLGGTEQQRLLDRIAADIGGAVEAVERFWGDDWPHRITVVATGSARQFAAEAGGGDPARWSDVAALAVADRVDPVRRQVTGQRLLFAPGAARMGPAALRLVLGHELFHYAARADTAADAPRWLTEGVADFVARAPATPADRPDPPLTLPSDAELDSPGPARARAYELAWWFAGFVAAEYGTASLRRLYLAGCAPGHPDLSAAVRQSLGADLPSLLLRWQRWGTG